MKIDLEYYLRNRIQNLLDICLRDTKVINYTCLKITKICLEQMPGTDHA